jgi:hypothetical protein
MKKIGTVIRWALTVLLLCGVYTETGKWTTLTFFFAFMGFEILGPLVVDTRTRLGMKKVL